MTSLQKPSTRDYRLSVELNTCSLDIRCQSTRLPWIVYSCQVSDQNLAEMSNGLCDNMKGFALLIQKSTPLPNKENAINNETSAICHYFVDKSCQRNMSDGDGQNNNNSNTVTKSVNNSVTNDQKIIEFRTLWNKTFRLTFSSAMDANNSPSNSSLLLLMQQMQQMQPMRVSFNGKGNVAANGECKIFNSYGIAKVVREKAGVYVIHFEKPMENSDYIVTVCGNLWGTGGVIIGLEGNNLTGTQYHRQKRDSFRIGSRCPRANRNQDCDLINAVVYP